MLAETDASAAKLGTTFGVIAIVPGGTLTHHRRLTLAMRRPKRLIRLGGKSAAINGCRSRRDPLAVTGHGI